MSQALELANLGLGQTAPNPSVGCVIVKDNVIVSTTRTQNGGRPHAEAIAINHINKKYLARATIYITLEPCCVSSNNETTCVEKIIEANFARVVIGTTDPNPKINGKSIKIFRERNIDVTVGVLQKECEKVIEGFKKRILTKIPLITLKLATSLDGKIALYNGISKWITSKKQRLLAQQLRAKNDAILTGIGTVIADNPLLTCRLPGVNYNPIRIVLDTDLKISKQSKIIQTSCDIKTIIITNKIVKNFYDGVKVISVKSNKYGLCLRDTLQKIADLGVNNLLVEAGQRLNTSFIRDNLVDKIVLFQSNKIIGKDGLDVVGNLNYSSIRQCRKFDTIVFGER